MFQLNPMYNSIFPPIFGPMTRKQLEAIKYSEEFTESEGFDISDFPLLKGPGGTYGAILPVRISKTITEAAEFAAAEKGLKLVDVWTCNTAFGPKTRYFITMEAVDARGTSDLYQARVVLNLREHTFKLELFRRRAKGWEGISKSEKVPSASSSTDAASGPVPGMLSIIYQRPPNKFPWPAADFVAFGTCTPEYNKHLHGGTIRLQHFAPDSVTDPSEAQGGMEEAGDPGVPREDHLEVGDPGVPDLDFVQNQETTPLGFL